MGLWTWLKSVFRIGRSAQRRSDADKPLISLVWLLREPRYLDDQILADLIHRAWKIDLRHPDPQATEFVVGSPPTFIVQAQGRNFFVHCFPIPYVKDVETEASSIPELRLRKAFLQHKAWIAVDLLFGQPGEDAAAAYPHIGKLMAELADTDCLALYSPATQQMIPFDEGLEEKLRGADVLDIFSKLVHVPVMEVADNDPHMLEAVAEARRRWPEFVHAFENRGPGQKFAVKAPFSDGVNTEFMWAMVTAIKGDQILGTLENEPVDIKSLRYGSRVNIDRNKLNDWVVSTGSSLQLGGFTIKVFEKLQRRT